MRQSLQHLTKKIVRSTLGVTWYKTQVLADHKKTISLKFPRKLRVEKQKVVPEVQWDEKPRFRRAILSGRLFLNTLIEGQSGIAAETSRNAFGTNQETNEDDSQSDLHPEAGFFQSQTTGIFGPEDPHDIYFAEKGHVVFFLE